MNWADEGRVIERAVAAMTKQGVPTTARNVERVVNTVEPDPAVAARIAGVERKLRAPENRGLVASVDTETGEVGTVALAPEPYFARQQGQASPLLNPTPGPHGQDDFAAELAKLKASAKKLQAAVDDPSLDRVTRERAQLELTQIRVRMAAIEAALAPPQTQMSRPTITYERDARGYIVGARKA